MKLTIKHCEEVMSQEITIGFGHTKDGKPKKFTFSVWDNEYVIYIEGKKADRGQGIEELLNEYNDL